MAFTFEELGANRILETKILLPKKEADGTVAPKPFHILFRDYPSAEHKRILEECRKEAERLRTEYEEKDAEYKKAHAEYENAVALYDAEKAAFEAQFQDGDAPHFDKPLPQNGFQPPTIPPSEQILYHARVIDDLPDLRGDTGQEIPPINVATFERLGENVNLCINSAIWQRRIETGDEKK